MKFLVDSDVLIELIRMKKIDVVEKFETHYSDCVLSSVTVAELDYGVRKSQKQEHNREQLDRVLQVFRVIDFTYQDAFHAGEIRAELERTGRRIGEHDTLIAAQARSRELTLVTGNVREFERVPGLRVENWLEAR